MTRIIEQLNGNLVKKQASVMRAGSRHLIKGIQLVKTQSRRGDMYLLISNIMGVSSGGI